MAPQDAATLMRLQYTVYLTGVFLSIPWKRLLSLVNKQIIKQCLRSVTMVSTLRPSALTTNFRDTITNITLQGGKWGPKTHHQVIAESQVLEFFLQINDSNTKNSSLFYEKPIEKLSLFQFLTYNCSLRDGRSPSRNLTSFSHRLSIRASCLSGSRINRRDTTLFITLSTSTHVWMTQQ